MKTLQFKWTVSRGRDTYGYNICRLYVDGERAAHCNGGGYDMKGTCLGDFIARTYRDRLLMLKPEDMPEQSHWEPDHNAFICRECLTERISAGLEPVTLKLKPEASPSADYPVCFNCGAEMTRDHHAGRRVDDGRYFYGLTFHDPNYDPGKAIIGKDCHNRSFDKNAEGKTVAEVENAGQDFGLNRLEAIYKASSHHATERHTVPSINGACGFSSVEQIMKAIGLELQWIPQRGRRSRSDDIYLLHDKRDAAEVAA